MMEMTILKKKKIIILGPFVIGMEYCDEHKHRKVFNNDKFHCFMVKKKSIRKIMKITGSKKNENHFDSIFKN